MAAPFKWYDRLVGSRPVVRIPAYATAGYFTGKFGSQLIGSVLTNLMRSRGMAFDENEVNDWLSKPQTSETMGVIGALLGGVAGAKPNWRAKSFGEFTKSIYDPQSVAKNTTEVPYYMAQGPGKSYADNREAYAEKTAFTETLDADEDDDPIFTQNKIPVYHSLSTINDDPFLDDDSKSTVLKSIYGADNKTSGLISGKQLMTGALRAGAAYVPAYYFGKTVGSILALPEDVSHKVSMFGGLASAIYNSGIVKQDF